MDRMVPRKPHSSLFAGPAFDRDDDSLDAALSRLSSRWKFDADTPARSDVDEDGDRFLVDDFHPRYGSSWTPQLSTDDIRFYSLIAGRRGLVTDDDFALLRESPPLLYHNDLTASVSRYYWSEDVGYALWLRLYHEYSHPGPPRLAS